MIFSGMALARRLEMAEAANDADCAPPGPGTAVERIAGGFAVFAGANSPISRAIGMGLSGPAGDAEIEALETFYHSRGGRVAVDLCPLADPSWIDALSRQGYRPAEFNNVLVRQLAGVELYADDGRVRPALDWEQDLWARTVGQGFFECSALSEDEMEIGRAVFQMGRAECYLGLSGDGEAVAGATLAVIDGLALLFADATTQAARRTGLHGALIRTRLNGAIARGCDLATASTSPGSGSQRNFERSGFQVAYTKVLLVEE